jgi:DNA-binding transcriptional regulator LsrR (DeoR family)
MADTTKISKEARKLCRHTVCFTDATSKLIAIRALQGMSTKAIAKELGITPSKVQYAILKAQRSQGAEVKFRQDYRNGKGFVAEAMLKSTHSIAAKIVSAKIAPNFARFAAPGVGRIS